MYQKSLLAASSFTRIHASLETPSCPETPALAKQQQAYFLDYIVQKIGIYSLATTQIDNICLTHNFSTFQPSSGVYNQSSAVG